METNPSDFDVRSQLDTIRRAFAETNDLKEIVGLHVRVVLIEDFLKTGHSARQILIEAIVLKLHVERKAGRILRRLRLRGGNHLLTHVARKRRLEQWGISDKESANWQMESRLPDEDFDWYTMKAGSKGRSPSSHGL